MIEDFLGLQENFNRNLIYLANNKLNEIIKRYSFLQISENFNMDKYQNIISNIKESKIIIIKQFQVDSLYYFIGFKNSVIMINQSHLSDLQTLFSLNSNLNICFLSKNNDIFDSIFHNKYKKVDFDQDFQNEIANFNQFLSLHQIKSKYWKIWSIIKHCISGFLIKQSYSKLSIDRMKNYINETINDLDNISTTKIIEENDFIYLRNLGVGSLFQANLIYHIEKDAILVIKHSISSTDLEIPKLKQREIDNYKNIIHPLIPKFYGITKENGLIIEYIKGQSLLNIKHLSFNEKIGIIFEIMLTIHCLHSNDFVYRDLKPNNLIIDENKAAVLIDFDRMIHINDNEINDNFTNNFSSLFIAPELNNGKVSFSCDIYSIGMMIKYIMEKDEIVKDSNIDYLYNLCTNKNPAERPSIEQIITFFYQKYEPLLKELLSNYLVNLPCIHIKKKSSLEFLFKLYLTVESIQTLNYSIGELHYFKEFGKYDIKKAVESYTISANYNYPLAQYRLGEIYENEEYEFYDINKSLNYYYIAANQNLPEAQYKLGIIYKEGYYLEMDIDRAIYYFQLAASQNYADAQYELGAIYFSNEYITQDVNKAIHFFEKAAEGNNPLAQYQLALIYSNGEYRKRDINKALLLYQLAAEQDLVEAQYNLGLIFFENKDVPCDMDKALYYLQQAANQDLVEAQYNLGYIFYFGINIEEDIAKSIYYFEQAAKHNFPLAQFYLGEIYYSSIGVKRDVNKAIYYYKLASNQNVLYANRKLGFIYLKDNDIPHDTNKAINYLSLAAKQSCHISQYILGTIFYHGIGVVCDIEKSIYYLELSANYNNPNAQCLLGLIYYENQKKRDINKAIYYFQLAANQNDSSSQLALGIIYKDSKYVIPNIEKAIYYFKQSANQNNPEAQYRLGKIYYLGKIVEKNMPKAIHYLTLASNNNNPNAQFLLGLFYYEGYFIQKNIKKSVDLYTLASFNGYSIANFVLGFIYHKENLIEKAIHFYKEGSSYNCQYSKNNLGIIYKNGLDKEIPQNIRFAILYFEEAIKQKKDPLAMYNLAHIYFFNEHNTESFNRSIELLIKSVNENFYPSNELLCLVLIKKIGNNLNNIKKEIDQQKIKTCGLFKKISEIIYFQKLFDEKCYIDKYNQFQKIDFLYDNMYEPIQSIELIDQKLKITSMISPITSEFYDGFGYDI